MTTVDALMDHLLPLSAFKSQVVSIQAGQTLDLEALKDPADRYGI